MKRICGYVTAMERRTVVTCNQAATVEIETFGSVKHRCPAHAECEKNDLWRIEKSTNYKTTTK